VAKVSSADRAGVATDIMTRGIMTKRKDLIFLNIASLQIMMGAEKHMQGKLSPANLVHIDLLRGILKPRTEVFVSCCFSSGCRIIYCLFVGAANV
jgi:hypothetical protein